MDGSESPITSSLDQPAPRHNDHPQCWPEVVKDMLERHQVGIARYGTPLQPHNGRKVLEDAYAEALDLVVYLKQELMQRDAVAELLKALQPFAEISRQLDSKRGDPVLVQRKLLDNARTVYVSFGGVLALD